MTGGPTIRDKGIDLHGVYTPDDKGYSGGHGFHYGLF